MIQSVEVLFNYFNDFSFHWVCFRILRGANKMQDFPILTGTKNLESL